MIIELKKQFKIDDAIAEQIIKLNEKKFETDFCCSGHAKGNVIGYIAFNVPSSLDLEEHNIVPPRGWHYEKTENDSRIGLYMDGINGTPEITEKYINERLQTLNDWVDELPMNALSSTDKIELKEVK